MLVSVIIPNYNHAKYLKKRIDTVLNQTYQNFEVLILDDCSTDNSRNIIEEYRNHEKVSGIIFNETNSGSTFKQWNKGIRLAKGELIWIAESDDFAEPDLLQNLKSEFDLEPELGIAYCQSNMVNDKDKVTGSWQSWTDDLSRELFKTRFEYVGKDYIKDYLIYKNTIPNASAVLFQKKYYEMIGEADETVLKCSDWLTWIKLLTVSNVVYVPQHLNNFRFHDESVIARVKKTADQEYIGTYVMLMRITLHHLLTNKFSDSKVFKIIIKNNLRILVKLYILQGLFYIEKNNWIKGVSIITKTIFGSVRNFVFTSELIINKMFKTKAF